MAVLGRSRSGPPPPDQILDPPLRSLFGNTPCKDMKEPAS